MPRVAAAMLAAALLAPGSAGANQASAALTARGMTEVYSLDRDQAIATFRQAIAADPNDAAAYRGLATALWLSITFRRGNMTVDDYLGRVTRPSTPPAPPPQDVARDFQSALDRSLHLAHEWTTVAPKDAGAHYQLGAALGIRASYAATVEASTFGAFKAARAAYDEEERALELDPTRKDAALIVGTYRYVVAALSMPLRWVAYAAGFGGGRARGLQMVEEAAAYHGDNQTDARIALVLLYNREHRYDDALTELAILRQAYPRNRLFWLESGATCLRAGRAADAERFLDDGIGRLAADHRPRMFGEEALWYYKRGAARAALGRAPEADADLRRSIALEGRAWVQGRAHLALGRLAMNAGDGPRARAELQSAIQLAGAGNDPGTADEARQLLKRL